MNLVTDTAPTAQTEAIAWADAYTSNAGLPSYTDLVETIGDLMHSINLLSARLPRAA